MRNQINKIAKNILRLETLKTQKSDSADFHDLAVWNIKEALELAYKAGQQSKKVTKLELDDSEKINTCDDTNPQFLFSTTERSLLIAIANDEIDAKALAAKELGNRGYKNNMVWVGFGNALKFWNKIIKK